VRGRVLFLSVVVIVAVPAWAAAQTAAPAEGVARSQVFQFQRGLMAAVEVGGQRLAEKARVVVPDTVLTPTEAPVVTGVKLEDYGYHFDVQVPNIDRTSMQLFDMFQQQQARRPRNPEGRLAEQGLPVAGRRETPTGPAVEAGAPAAFEADKEYGASVKEALIDSMLDGSAMLPIAPNEKLALTVSAMQPPGGNALNLLLEPKLVLTIKGSDLIDLRQGRITRDVAKARIQVSSF
jgi:hypothetical protein